MIKIGKKHYNEPGKRETAGYFHVERATAKREKWGDYRGHFWRSRFTLKPHAESL